MARSLRPRKGSTARRIVWLEEGQSFDDFEQYQQNYLNLATHDLIPSTEVYSGDRLVHLTNSLGFKGEELVPDRPIIAFFGDSVVQGVGAISFVDFVRIEPFQMLNGGVEGSTLEMSVARFQRAREKVDIACAVLHPGWHNLIYGNNNEEHWRAEFEKFSGVPLIAHIRLTGDQCSDSVEHGYGALCGADYTQIHSVLELKRGREKVRETIARFNAFQDAFCREHGRPVITLEKLLAPRDMSEVAKHFSDFGHPRPQYYRAIGRTIARQLKRHVAPLVGEVPANLPPLKLDRRRLVEQNPISHTPMRMRSGSRWKVA